MLIRTFVPGILISVSLLLPVAQAGEIHAAARQGDLGRVRSLLQSESALVQSADNHGRTPLHIAAAFGQLDIVKLLLQHGAQRDLADKHGRQPIDIAAARGQLAIVNLLVNVEVVRLADNVSRITLAYGTRTNIGVSNGPDGLLLVDTGTAEVAEKLKEVVTALGKGAPHIIINTHRHATHIGGNALLGSGARIIDGRNLKQHVTEGVLKSGPEPLRGKSGRVFDKYYILPFNGEQIHIIPMPGGHTAEDLIVHFVDSGVVFMSDLLDSQSFPPCGANVQHYLEILDRVIDVFPAETKFIAGHGRDCTLDEVKAYRAMLDETIAVVRAHTNAGQSVAQMRAAIVLEKWSSWGEFLPQLGPDYWIEAVYLSYQAELKERGSGIED